MKWILSLLFLCSLQIGFAQYTPLESSGDIPPDFRVTSSEKYKKELSKVDKDAKRRTRKTQKEFFLESSFGIDDLLKSGLVMFNDPVSKYVQDVANVLLEDEPKLKKQLRFYAVRTPSVNAFATGQGVVLVNMGLIAQLENEAQLAFILAHEIAHFREKHSLKFYVESKTIDRQNSRGYFKQKQFDDKLAKNQFSKEQESEADALGLELFAKSKYDFESVQGAFDVLQYSYLPFDNLPFDKSYFEDEYLVFNDDYQVGFINDITLKEDEDDSESTHPSLPKRRLAAQEFIDKKDNNNRQNYLVSESRFLEIQQLARYESLDYYLRGYGYVQAIYNAFLLQKTNPDDLYLKKVIAKSLYGIVKFKNGNRFINELKVAFIDVEGESGKLFYFINKLNDLETNVLALRYIYSHKADFKDDVTYQKMLEDVVQELVNLHDDEIENFKAEKAPEPEPTVKVPGTKEKPIVEEIIKEDMVELKSKYDQIRVKREEEVEEKEPEVASENSPYLYYGLGDILEKEDFIKMLEDSRENKKMAADWKKELKEMKPKNRYMKNGDYALGEKKLLVINPFYMKLSKNFEEPMLIPSEKSQIAFTKKIKENAKRLGLKLVMLDGNSFSKKDVETFNELKEMQDWFGHHLEMDDEKMIAFNQERIDAIAEKYGVDAVLWTGVIAGKQSRNLLEYYIKLLVPVTYFEWIYSLVIPRGESLIFSMVRDIDTGKARMSTFNVMKSIDNQDLINQRVYDILQQVKKKK